MAQQTAPGVVIDRYAPEPAPADIGDAVMPRQTFIDDVGERGKKALDIVLEQADKSGDAD